MSTRPLSPKPDAPEMPVAVLVVVKVPPSFRGLSEREVRRKLVPNREMMLDEIAKTIVRYFNKPVDYAEVMTLLGSQLPPKN